MPGCVLRVSGSAFDVDSFLRDSSFDAAVVYRRGETRQPKSRGPARTSGFNVVVSEDYDDIEIQTKDALIFLRKNEAEIRRAREYLGVEYVELDFSTSFRSVVVQSEGFSPPIIAAAGALGLGLKVSFYPPDSGKRR